ncbi:MAG: hypothetical protein A3I61_06270 [Acidobacteria bacterium RIFCSPLOWO2_02_FULL_68_18]|nr:MAG: hypothetical protein A3I61_06270 [Acidobacteria bacterium RIFCSPLOWO2_02_FULL_68_18]OFW52016.1 MAG: hypothetical protein A3G77_04670 [Acidobacteria bacterium RIFCSPLOWO2_12_FULL_68_19]
MFTPVILSIPALVLPLLAPPQTDCQLGRLGDPGADERAVAAFEVAVNDYVELHRRLERAWPPAYLSGNPEYAEAAAEALRAALREARPQAAPGGLFTPEVADAFRLRIAQALGGDEEGLAVLPWPPDRDPGVDHWRPMVSQPIPWGVSGMRWPLLAMLPPLPPELAYRFIGRDLVLVDVHANFIVDILELALPTHAAPCPTLETAPGGEEFEGCRPE